MKKFKLEIQDDPKPQSYNSVYTITQVVEEVRDGHVVKVSKQVEVDNRDKFKVLKSSDYSIDNVLAAGLNPSQVTLTDTSLFNVDYQNQALNQLLDQFETLKN